MFNLLMSGNAETLRGEPWTLERNRVFEHTDAEVGARFIELNPAQLNEVCTFPALIAYERGIARSARIGRIDRVRIRDGEVRIEYSFAPGLPEIPPKRLQALEWELGLTQFELNRTHWALKDVDLAAELMAAGVVTPDQINALPPDFRRLFGFEAIVTCRHSSGH
jgi:hypothetical protein